MIHQPLSFAADSSDKKDYLLSVEGNKLQTVVPTPAAKDFIIPLIKKNNWRLQRPSLDKNDENIEGGSVEDEEAAQAILKAAGYTYETAPVCPKDYLAFSIFACLCICCWPIALVALVHSFRFKHGTRPVKLEDIPCRKCYQLDEVASISQYRRDNYNLHLPSTWSLIVPVYLYGAVVARSTDLVNVGDFIEINQLQVWYSVLLATVQSKGVLGSLCAVQGLEKMKPIDGTILLNEFDCPLLILTSDIYFVSPLSISKPISVCTAVQIRVR